MCISLFRMNQLVIISVFFLHSFQIPSLNDVSDYTVYNKKLIRFRGMIQDILNPIYYVEKFEILNMKTNQKFFRSGKYRDSVDLNVLII